MDKTTGGGMACRAIRVATVVMIAVTVLVLGGASVASSGARAPASAGPIGSGQVMPAMYDSQGPFGSEEVCDANRHLDDRYQQTTLCEFDWEGPGWYYGYVE